MRGCLHWVFLQVYLSALECGGGVGVTEAEEGRSRRIQGFTAGPAVVGVIRKEAKAA